MDIAQIERRKQEVIARYGPWLHDDIRLADGLCTGGANDQPRRLWRVMQVLSDMVPRPLRELRVLDLGCQEGIFSVELAQHAATVIGIEGREASVARNSQPLPGRRSIQPSSEMRWRTFNKRLRGTSYRRINSFSLTRSDSAPERRSSAMAK